MRLVASKILTEIAWVRHGMLAPAWCNGGPDSADNLSFASGPESQVRQARARAAELLGTDPGHFTHVYQVHGSTVFDVTIADRGKGGSPSIPQVGQGDALITADPWLPMAILVADCLPVFLADRRHQAVGLAHAGWKGTLARVTVETLNAMHERFGTDAADVSAWIAPGIGRCCFEVGPEIIDRFACQFPAWDDCWSISSARIDLKEMNSRILQSEGVYPENIEVSGDCTMCEPGYFSYRREGSQTGHNMASLMIVE